MWTAFRDLLFSPPLVGVLGVAESLVVRLLTEAPLRLVVELSCSHSLLLRAGTDSRM